VSFGMYMIGYIILIVGLAYRGACDRSPFAPCSSTMDCRRRYLHDGNWDSDRGHHNSSPRSANLVRRGMIANTSQRTYCESAELLFQLVLRLP